jgi:hypothetical protein
MRLLNLTSVYKTMSNSRIAKLKSFVAANKATAITCPYTMSTFYRPCMGYELILSDGWYGYFADDIEVTSAGSIFYHDLEGKLEEAEWDDGEEYSIHCDTVTATA